MKNVKNLEKPSSLKYLGLKEAIHPLLLKVFTLKTTGKLIVDGKLPEEINYLIVANHLCIEDIPTLAQAVKKHFYLLVSDEDKDTIDGLALNLNGVEWVHRLGKESRQLAASNGVIILSIGKIFAMYPEATWNLSPNDLVMNMNYGCIRMVLEAKKPILPVISFFTGEERHTKIGDLFYPSDNLKQSIGDLRDIMATLYYYEIEDYYKRNYEKKDDIICMKNEDGTISYFESRDELKPRCWDEYVDEKYGAYGRARKDKQGVREFESQFIFTPKDDAHLFFQVFNSRIMRNENGEMVVTRISSERDGYNGPTFGQEGEKDFFGYGYNEKVFKDQLARQQRFADEAKQGQDLEKELIRVLKRVLKR